VKIPSSGDILKALAANVPWEYFDGPLGLASKLTSWILFSSGKYNDPMECDTYDFIRILIMIFRQTQLVTTGYYWLLLVTTGYYWLLDRPASQPDAGAQVPCLARQLGPERMGRIRVSLRSQNVEYIYIYISFIYLFIYLSIYLSIYLFDYLFNLVFYVLIYIYIVTLLYVCVYI